MYPQWGGVAIVNRPVQSATMQVSELIKPFHLFAGQFRRLLGLCNAELAQYDVDSKLLRVYQAAIPSEHGITSWELDAYISKTTLDLVTTTVATLNGLIRLLNNIQELPVGDHIQRQVIVAIEAIHQCQAALAHQDWIEAHRAARKGLAAAESAFFDPSMVGRVYFPQDHKYAVYTPLFFPVILPILVALLRLVVEKCRRMYLSKRQSLAQQRGPK